MLAIYSSFLASHDLQLLVLASLISLLASYTTFSLMTRLYAPNSRYPWVVATAIVTGCGAWATHAIALLAFRPGLPVAYDVTLTLAAGMIAVLGSGVGFLVARSTERMALGGAIVGFAIGAMHYVAMAGVQLPAQRSWDANTIATSLLVGASFGAAALSRAQLMPNLRGRLISALLLTTGIGATYFVGMAALTLSPDPSIIVGPNTFGLIWFAIALTSVVLMIVGLGVVGTLVDQHIGEIEATKRELEAALRLADAANKSKTTFLATMSHELRTPLNAIIGFSEVMKDGIFGRLSERYRDYATNVFNSGTHLLGLINEILDLSKLEAGRLELHEENINLAATVEECMKLVETQAQQSKIRLSVSLDSDSIWICADDRRLRQILINILSNAVKFTPEGGQVRVSSFRKDGGLAIEVSDTGIGMAPEYIPKAFMTFSQADSVISRKHEGTGLGLPLAKQLVELHGGTLAIESEVNVGTTVTIVLPPARIIAKQARLATIRAVSV